MGNEVRMSESKMSGVQVRKIEIKVKPVFNLHIGETPILRGADWRALFREGKKNGEPFAITMRQFTIAEWHPEQGFHLFVDPDFILQNEQLQREREVKAIHRAALVKPVQTAAH